MGLRRGGTEDEGSRQQTVTHCGGMIAGASKAADHRVISTGVATRTDVERIDIAGEVHLPIAGGNIDSGECLEDRNHPNPGAGCDRKLGTRIHETSARFEVFVVTSRLLQDVARSRPQLFPLAKRTLAP